MKEQNSTPNPLDALSPQQRERLMELARARRHAANGNLHDKFEQWVIRRPQAVAVSHGKRHVCYGELG
ncbi:hypothetical protein, partial [Massilia sp. Root335]|uniref:hypothetical protein n=1 Tax=Massilia sp. Root335 TaxID=1736517 RepID=UPI00138F8357